MPYISGQRRLEVKGLPENPGELNFAITKLLHTYMQYHGLRYQTINDCLGAVEGAKLEFYRRVAVPYEHKKMADNGDLPYTENLIV